MWRFADKTAWTADEEGVIFQLAQLEERPVIEPALLPVGRLVEVRIHPTVTGSKPCPGAQASAVFPGEFEFCPTCATKLLRPDFSRDAAWRPPFGNLESTRICDRLLNDPSEVGLRDGEQVRPPFAYGRCRFLVTRLGAASRLLFALDLREGLVAVYSPGQKDPWFELKSPLDSAGLPDWSWTVATNASEQCLAVPDASGLKWIRADWPNGSLEVITRLNGRCLGGPGVVSEMAPGKPPTVSDTICVPMLDENGHAVLRWWREGRAGDWSALPLPPEVPHDEIFGQPVRPRRRMLAWPGRYGVLLVQMGATESPPTVTWKNWPNEPGYSVRGLPELGPAWRDGSNVLWQTCEQRGGGRRGDDITIKRLRIDSPQELIDLPYGDILSTGHASFSRYHDHWRHPDEYVDTEPDRDDIRLPLLQFMTTGNSGPEPGLTFMAHLRCPDDVDTIDLSETLCSKQSVRGQMALEISGPSTSPVWLRLPGGSTEWWDTDSAAFGHTDVCIYDGYLWVYLSQPARVYRWPLAMTTK